MDRNSFETIVRAEGYTPVFRALDPDLAVDAHDHAWDTKGLVLSGEFTIDCGGGDARTYRAGEVFVLGAGIEHTEGTGSDGAELLVGRRKIEG